MTKVDSTSKEKKEVKNKKISESIKTTKKKRKHQQCTCYELKINQRRLNSKQREALSMMFVEAKWLYNDVLNSGLTPSQYDDKTTTVMVKYPDGFQERQLQYLSASMRQKLLSTMSSSIKTLNTLKKRGKKVGTLKFISDYTSIGLKQYTKTHKFDFQRNRAHIQNIPGWVRVHGLKQIPHNAEIADARLLKRASGYYVKVTTFTGKKPANEQKPLTTIVGVDMGVATTQTCVCGRKNKIPLNQRIYSCECGRELPRDVHAAQMMVVLGRFLVPMDCREFTLVENVDSWGSSEFCEHSVKPEALTLQC